MQIFYSLTVILMFTSFIMSAVNVSDNILKEIQFDFKSKIFNKFEVKTKFISKSKHKNYLKIKANDSIKQLKLSEFLSDKLIQYSDKLDLIQIIPDKDIKLIVEEESLPKYVCNLKQLIESTEQKDNQLCPFDWNINIRKNKFPFHRAYATCKCSNCQAIVSKNIVTACRPDYMLFPMLYRESFDDKENLIENWKFYLEKVAISCSCSSFSGL
jgi:hypothetical protein